jgi:hypothetical protein
MEIFNIFFRIVVYATSAYSSTFLQGREDSMSKKTLHAWIQYFFYDYLQL